MSDLKQVAQDFLEALSTNTAECYVEIFTDDVSLLIARWDGREVYRPQARVIKRLRSEWSAWPDPIVERLNVIDGRDQVNVEFRIQATENDRYVEHNRSAALKIKDGKIEQIRLYCPEAVPSARRSGWIAPATLSDEELNRLFESMGHAEDPYEWLPPTASGRKTLRGGNGGTGETPHPGSNGVGGIRWTAAEADRKIEEIIELHRARNVGFQWWVSPFDTPIDLRERLEKHGLVLAGEAATMARAGLDRLDIPINPQVTVELLDGQDEAAIDAVGEISMICVNWTREQWLKYKPGFSERLRDAKFSQQEGNYLAYFNGQPVAYGRVQFQAGVAYLGGASTLPEFRGQKIYSTLLRQRLESAHSHGYQIAAVNAEPMSRPILAHYGFKEYARTYIYGWMPVIDLDVIRSLVPQ